MAASMKACIDNRYSASDEEDDDYPGIDDTSGDELIDTCAPSQCLFCDHILSDGEKMIVHCVEDHGVPLKDLFRDDSITFYSFIKLVNFFRKSKSTPVEYQSTRTLTDLIDRLDDSYMIPEDTQDGLLQFDFDTYQEKLQRTYSPACDSESVSMRRSEYEALQTQASLCERYRKELAALKEQYSEDVSQLRESARRILTTGGGETFSHNKGEESSPANKHNHSQVHSLKGSEDDEYISSYSHYSIHMEMLQDFVRTDSYRRSIEENTSLFSDRVVLDVGCGTGILSMFAARAGAKHVIAVDMSDVIYQAMDIVRENGLEKKITLIKGRIEDISLPAGIDKVDVIISEWMGYFLLFESMLDSVIYARQKWLQPDGLVWPNKCDILLTASSDPSLYEKYIEYWDDVYGFTMSCMKGEVCREALVQVVNKDFIVAESSLIKTVDCCSDSISDLDFSSSFTLSIDKDCTVYALIGYFDTMFDAPDKAPTKVTFSTGPLSQSTHWKQTVFLLPKPLHHTAKGEQLSGNIDVRKLPKDPRSLQVKITIKSMTIKYILA